MADDVSFMQEIDESLRAEKLEQFWQRSGNLVIAGCVGVVLLTSASVLWKNHLREVHTRETSVLIQADAYVSQGKTKEAVETLEGIENNSGGIATLAKLKHAELLLQQKEQAKAIALYTDIAADRHNDDALRSLAGVQATVLESGTAGAVKASATASAPFDGILTELSALRLIREGKIKDARLMLTRVADNAALPASERTRAREILYTLNGDDK